MLLLTIISGLEGGEGGGIRKKGGKAFANLWSDSPLRAQPRRGGEGDVADREGGDLFDRPVHRVGQEAGRVHRL